MEPTASVLRAVGVASRPGSRRPRGVHRQTPGDERPLRRPTARTSGSPPGDGETADDAPSFLEHAVVSFSGALGRLFPSDGDDAALASFKRLPHVRRSLARDVHRRLPAPRRHPTPTARSVALKVAAGTDHARLGRDRLYQPCAPRDWPHDPTGCVAFPDTARLTGTRAVSRNPIAVQGEAKMNKNELVSHVAAETSATRATAERMVGAVFSAIGDALARDEPVAIAGFGQFVIRDRAARQGRNPQTGEPVAIAASKVPSFKAAKALRDAVNG